MIAERLNEKCWKNLKTLEAAGVLDVKIEEFVHFNQLKMSSLHGMIDIIHLENYFKQDYTKHNKNFSMIYPVGSPYRSDPTRARKVYYMLADPRLILLIEYYFDRVDMKYIKPSEVPWGELSW